jgi:hypothetical protein
MNEEESIKKIMTFVVECKDYWDGIDYFLEKYETYPNPIDDVRRYYNKEGDRMVIVIMTPIGDLWTFEIEKESNGNYLVSLIGNSYLTRKSLGD